MNAVDCLRDMLDSLPLPDSHPQPDLSVIQTACAGPLLELRQLNQEMERRIRGAEVPSIPEAHIQEVLHSFWLSLKLDTFREAVHVCAGLSLPLEASGLSIMDDQKRLLVVLNGLQPWRHSPRRFRRCFYGLMHGYFSCDPHADPQNDTRTQNWRILRDYLREAAEGILEPELNPDWAHYVQRHIHLFGDQPWAHYAAGLAAGDHFITCPLRGVLRICETSWFWRELGAVAG